MLVMEAFGRALVLEPYLATVVLGGTAVRLGGSAAQQSAILPQIVDGSLKLAFAHGEQQARYDADRRDDQGAAQRRRLGAGRRQKRGAARRLRGQAGGQRAHRRRARRCERTHAVPGGCRRRGVTRRGYPLRDGTRAADIVVFRCRRWPPTTCWAKWMRRSRSSSASSRRALPAMAAEAVGAMDKMHAMTLEYLKTRQQFGKPIG